jgi:RNA polymerase sigma-70 factor (ECF subfamily)
MAAVWETVNGLSARQRDIFLLRFVEEMELTDIAEVTGLPLSTVKTHLYRALASVRSKHAGAEKEAK